MPALNVRKIISNRDHKDETKKSNTSSRKQTAIKSSDVTRKLGGKIMASREEWKEEAKEIFNQPRLYTIQQTTGKRHLDPNE